MREEKRDKTDSIEGEPTEKRGEVLREQREHSRKFDKREEDSRG